MSRIPVTLLGATGVVGQRFARRLAAHPRFELRHLCASERSRGRRYDEACRWHLGGEPWAGLGGRVLEACDPAFTTSRVVFSALDAGVARELEPAYAAGGALVFSNASAFRQEADVPLLVPEVNPGHLALLEVQRARRGWRGGLVTNPNCTTSVLVMALAPLHRAFGVEALLVASLQAASGAGYPGVSALDLLGNVIPHIPEEEAKVERELLKLLGSLGEEGAEAADFPVSAMCHRVPVLDGHTLALSLRLGGDPSPEQVEEVLRAWEPPSGALPSAPRRPLVLHGEEDRPQPRRDAEAEGGMAVHVGRIRRCPCLGLKLTLMGHNTERGAAGGSILNAELAEAAGALP